MYILGLSCFYHDASAALIKDGILLAAAQEERFTRKKHDSSFPRHAIQYCFSEAGITSKDLDYIGFYDKPLVKFERILTTYLATYPRSIASFLKAMPIWLKEKLWTPQIIRRELDYGGPIIFSEHHMSHAASAFLVSPFQEAAILTADGVGEWDTTTLGIGRKTDIQLLKSLSFPHSLGLLYSSFTYFLGFKVNSAEYKIMGLAPYGRPSYYDLILNELIILKDDGSFRLNMKYFAYDYGLRMTNKQFNGLFHSMPRIPESPLTQFHKDLAASIQKVIDEVMVRMASSLRKETGMKHLCLAGGVALNCVSNSKIRSLAGYEDVFIQPAASDAGGAVGSAYFIYNTLLHHDRNYTWQHNFIGPSFSDEYIEQQLENMNILYRVYERHDLLKATAALLADQKVVGWFQGRMEFGPRALGARSILADARNPNNFSRVNLKIKFRESFRPFAPTVLIEKAKEYFDFDQPSPYMLFVAQVKNNKRIIPAVTHVDGSARLQTLERDDHPLYYDLITEYERVTGCPILINTSFNVRGEPIVCTPFDAIKCFLRTNMDYLVIGSYIINKEEVMNSGRQIYLDDVIDPD
jgi:carbamoyltransferase